MVEIASPPPTQRLRQDSGPTNDLAMIVYAIILVVYDYFLTIKIACATFRNTVINKQRQIEIDIKMMFASYQVPIYTPGWRAAMWIKCQKRTKVPGIDGNLTRNPLTFQTLFKNVFNLFRDYYFFKPVWWNVGKFMEYHSQTSFLCKPISV